MLFAARLDNNNSFPHPLSAEKEKEYLVKMKNGDANAKDVLIRHNLRLVVYIAKKYANYPDPDELISVGTLGLIKAINSFQPDKGTQLATYASRCIDNEMLMVLRSNKKLKNNTSLFENIGTDKDGNELTLMDTLATNDENVFNLLDKDILNGKLYEVIEKTLTAREKQIILLRFGLDGSARKTQQDVADMLGISRSYVSRLEKNILKKMHIHLADYK